MGTRLRGYDDLYVGSKNNATVPLCNSFHPQANKQMATQLALKAMQKQGDKRTLD
jgi:gamma-glutamyl-gamma-aminobutyrate hydrolase PuuD